MDRERSSSVKKKGFKQPAKTIALGKVLGQNIDMEKDDRCVAERHGIRRLKAGKPYVPSDTREMRDQIRSFTRRNELCDLQFDRCYKVLAQDLSQGFNKAELIDFLRYFQQHCKLQEDLLDETEVEVLFRKAGGKDAKNSKEVLTKFMNLCLSKQQDYFEYQLKQNKSL